MSRHEFMKELAELGIGTQVHYIPIHYHPYYQNMGFKRGDFPVAERYYEQALTLPLFYALPADRVDFISSAVKGTLNKKQPTTAQQAIDK
jgi:dTDP-4-amino-4,6-dideoxygalactose transaminase